VLLYHLPPDGYEYGSSLPVTGDAAAARWAAMRSVLVERATTGVAILLNGADHHARQRDQAEAVAALAAAAHPVELRAATLREGAAALRGAAANSTLALVAGELRDSYGYTWTLGGTLAARAAQKRANAHAERTLVRDVEPWLALADGSSAAGERALLRAAWRDLLRAHPHDTLCGTSVDAVALAFDQRVATVIEQAVGLREGALVALTGHDVERARLSPGAWRSAMVIRNPAPRPRSGVADVTLDLALMDIAVGPGSATRQGPRAQVDESMLAVMGMQPLARGERVQLTESPRAYPDADLVHEVRALMWVGPMAGYSVATRLVGTPAREVPPAPVMCTERSLENEWLRVTVDEHGAVTLHDLAGLRAVDGLLAVGVERDAGDLYTPAIREALAGFRVRSCERTLGGPLRGELTIALVSKADASSMTLRLQLDAGLRALRVLVCGDNRLADARLRLVFATGCGDAARTVADAAFHPLERAPLDVPPEEQLAEHVVRTAPLHRFVSRYGGGVGTTVFSDGLAEYEALGDGRVAITLLRAVGELSRHDLPERPGHAGWPAPVPLAQSIGPYEAAFAIALHSDDSPPQRDAVERLADDVLLPITAETRRSNLADALIAGGLELEGDGLAFSAAMPAREPGWIVLRCVNRRGTIGRGRWRLLRSVVEARLARLDETPGRALAVHGGTIEIECAPMEIVTVVARLAD